MPKLLIIEIDSGTTELRGELHNIRVGVGALLRKGATAGDDACDSGQWVRVRTAGDDVWVPDRRHGASVVVDVLRRRLPRGRFARLGENVESGGRV